MAIDKNLIPNARRDYFNINETLREFETALNPILYQEAYSLYHYANKVKLSFRKQYDIQQKENEFNLNIQKGKFLNKNDEEKSSKKN